MDVLARIVIEHDVFDSPCSAAWDFISCCFLCDSDVLLGDDYRKIVGQYCVALIQPNNEDMGRFLLRIPEERMKTGIRKNYFSIEGRTHSPKFLFNKIIVDFYLRNVHEDSWAFVPISKIIIKGKKGIFLSVYKPEEKHFYNSSDRCISFNFKSSCSVISTIPEFLLQKKDSLLSPIYLPEDPFGGATCFIDYDCRPFPAQ